MITAISIQVAENATFDFLCHRDNRDEYVSFYQWQIDLQRGTGKSTKAILLYLEQLSRKLVALDQHLRIQV